MGQSMGGRPGRSGGANALAPAAHVLRGTFRPDRHSRPSTDPAAGADWKPTRRDLAALGPAGRAFVARMRTEFQFDFAEGQLVLEAGHASDELKRLRAVDRDSLKAQQTGAHDRRLRQWSHHYAALL